MNFYHDNLEFLGNEIDISLRADFSLVVKTYEIFKEQQITYLVMEFIHGYSLLELINSTTNVDENEINRLFKQIVVAI